MNEKVNVAEVNRFLKIRQKDPNFVRYIKQIRMTNIDDSLKEKQVADYISKNYGKIVQQNLIKAIAHYALL